MHVKRSLQLGLFSAVLCTSALVGPIAGSAGADTSRQVIVFSRQLSGGGSEQFISGPYGHHVAKLGIPFVGEDLNKTTLSHDGRRLLYSNIPYFNPTTGDFVGFRPATSAPDGTHFHLLALPHRGEDMYCSAWTPTDRRIVCADASNTLFSMRASDGADRVRLTKNPYGAQDFAVGYSPSGKRFAFLRRKGDDWALMLANAKGAHIKQLTPFGLLVQHDLVGANWSPDGKSIISAMADGHLIIVQVDRSRVTIVQLQLAEPYFAIEPDFSPDGRHIVFSAFVEGHAANLYRADVDGSHVIQLTHSPENEFAADWAVVAD
jgi:Tol biopolymer transport system component